MHGIHNGAFESHVLFCACPLENLTVLLNLQEVRLVNTDYIAPSMKADVIATSVKHHLELFKISSESKVTYVTDRGANMPATFRGDNFPCIAHIIHNVVRQTIASEETPEPIANCLLNYPTLLNAVKRSNVKKKGQN